MPEPDPTIEFYKLAAQIIPVLALGGVLQQIHPDRVFEGVARIREMDESGETNWEFDDRFPAMIRRTWSSTLAAFTVIPLALLGEILALYGVGSNTSSTPITATVSVGIAMSALLLVGPIWVAWYRVWFRT